MAAVLAHVIHNCYMQRMCSRPLFTRLTVTRAHELAEWILQRDTMK